MRKLSISVAEAARNFADCVNRVHSQGVTFVLSKNGLPVACLVPYSKKVCTGRDLAQALSKADLTKQEAVVWNKDLHKARKTLKSPRNLQPS